MRRAAAALPEVIFHFTDGCPEGGGRDETENFQRVAYVPYDRYLPRYDLVVHHAGAGVLNWCLAHGIPGVVFPVDFDQFDYAARLTHAGLARRLDALSGLTDSVKTALADEPMRRRCETFRRTVAAAPPPVERIAEMVRAAGPVICG